MKLFQSLLITFVMFVFPLTTNAQNMPLGDDDTNAATTVQTTTTSDDGNTTTTSIQTTTTTESDDGLLAQPKPPVDSLASRPKGFQRCMVIPEGYYFGAWETMHLQCFYKHQSIWITGHFRCVKQHHIMGKCRGWEWIPGNWLLR
jgi:hypothetical protein